MSKPSFIRSLVLLAILGLAFLAVSSCGSDNHATQSQPVPQPEPEFTVPPSASNPTAQLPGAGIPGGPAGPITTAAPPPASITTVPPPRPTPSPGFEQIAKEQSGLVTANAYWRRPDALTVDKSDQIGLGIQSAPLTSQINQQLNDVPGTTQPAGQIRLSPHATATLEVTSGEADVAPSGSRDNSTPDNVDLAWIWTVRPKRPTSDLLGRPTGDLILTANIVVHLEGGPNDVVTTTKTLRIPVHRTLSYTAGEIAKNWGTWAGIIGVPSVAGAIGWFRKRKQGKEEATDSATAKQSILRDEPDRPRGEQGQPDQLLRRDGGGSVPPNP